MCVCVFVRAFVRVCVLTRYVLSVANDLIQRATLPSGRIIEFHFTLAHRDTNTHKHTHAETPFHCHLVCG